MPEDPEQSAALRALDDMDGQAEQAEGAEPHSVIAYDPMTRSYTVIGPYPDAHAATIAAELLQAELNAAAGAPGYPTIRTWIALHFPATNGKWVTSAPRTRAADPRCAGTPQRH